MCAQSTLDFGDSPDYLLNTAQYNLDGRSRVAYMDYKFTNPTIGYVSTTA